MALIHPQSCESVDTGLDLFSIPPTQTSIEEGQFIEFHPLSSLSPSAPIEFAISGGGTEYLDFSNTYLHVRAKVTKAAGGNLDGDAQVAPVNYWLHSLFSQVDISLNDTLISPSENTYPYRAYIEAALNYGKDAKRSHLTAALFHRDSSNHFDDTEGNENSGLKVRRLATAQSQEVDMMGRLHTDIMAQDRYLLNGVDVKIRLIRSKHAFNLMAHGAAPTYLSVITHASLFVRKCKLNPAVSLAHAKALEKGTAKYPMKRVILKTFSIPRGNLSAVQDNLFLSQLPTRIIIGLVESATFNGAFGKNPFNFKPHGLSFLSLFLEGKQIPSKPLTPNFENKMYVRSFFSLFTGTGLANKDAGNVVEYRDFGGGYALFAFDLSPSLLDGNQVELLKSGSLRLELKFNTALPEPVVVIAYAELDALLEIDRSRQILSDFTA